MVITGIPGGITIRVHIKSEKFEVQAFHLAWATSGTLSITDVSDFID